MSFKQQWAESMVEVRKVIADGGQLIAVASYHGTNRVLFALVFPPRLWRRYHNDNRKKRE